MKIDHPNVTRAYELLGQDARGNLRTVLWVEANADLTPIVRDERGMRMPNRLRIDIWEAAQAFARKNAISQILIQARLIVMDEPPTA